MDKCPHCGEQVETTDNYCRCCGKSFEEWEAEEGFPEPNPERGLSTLAMIKEAFLSFYKPMPLHITPSKAIFTDRFPAPLTPYLGLAVGMLATGLLVAYGGEWYTYLGLTIGGYATPVILLFWVFRSDRYEREPLALVAYCFGWGAFIGIAAAILNSVITVPYLGAGGAGFVEEPLKILGVYLIAKSRFIKSEFNDHLDGMVYGAAAGAGFAGLENFFYIYQMVTQGIYAPFTAILIRSITAFMHISWTAIAGRSLGLAKVIKGSIGLRDLIPGVTLAATLHLFWNISPSIIAFTIILPFTVETLRMQIKMALEDETRWGFQCFPPDEH